MRLEGSWDWVTISDLKKIYDAGLTAYVDGDRKVVVVELPDSRPETTWVNEMSKKIGREVWERL